MPYIVAMSGGVDSSVAMLLAKETLGEDALGVTLDLSGTDADRENSRDAAAICETLGVPHMTLDAADRFREQVKDYFVSEYLAGRTPNPCVVCNREIKLGLLAEFADREGRNEIVTGHYARTEKLGSYTYIRKAADRSKDQSYMLAMLSQEQIARARFPLGGLTKAEVREIAAGHGFASASRRDSQDICFVPDGDYVGFISRTLGAEPAHGEYVDAAGNILGRHRGQIRYTIGQRKGLGIALGRHVFVLSKDAAENRVTLGDEAALFRREVKIAGLNLPSDPHALDGEVRCTAKIRYAHREAAATFARTGEDEGVLLFDEAVRAPSPGQFAVMYDGEYVIGAGKIEL